MVQLKRDELFMFTMRMSAVDKAVLDGLCDSLDMSNSDVVKCALYEFANAQKDTLLKSSLKELAKLKQLDFKMQVMKEVEHITHKQAYYLDGLMNTLKDYHSKYVPVGIVKRYVTVKIISLYTLYSMKQRREFCIYLSKHFLHFYPKERVWLEKQLKYIRNMKKNEKDELLAKIAGDMPQVPKLEGSAGMRGSKADVVPFVPSKAAEAEDAEAKGKK